jgi:hypothetical protein
LVQLARVEGHSKSGRSFRSYRGPLGPTEVL